MKKEKEKNDQEEFDDLAQGIVVDYFTEGEVVNPCELARCFDIEVRAGDYENYFRGLVRYNDLKFKIYLNNNVIYSPDSEMGRYTCAHELGHTIIPAHRAELMSGNSLASVSEHTHFQPSKASLYEIELQAQSFAASLLMPRDWFVNTCSLNDICFKHLFTETTKTFQTSFTSCAVRYVKLDISKSVFIRIGDKFWQVQSRSFQEMYDGRLYFTYNPDRNRISVSKEIIHGELPYEVSYVNLSSWTANIPPGSSADQLVKEEIIRTNNYTYCLLTVEDGRW